MRKTLVSLLLTPLAALALQGSATAASPSTTTAVDPGADSAVSTAGAVTGSIVYLQKNNIWIMRGDGSGKRQVTRDGTAGNPYRSPSQSDTGTIAAARGTLIVRMTQAGLVLNTIDPPALKNSVSHMMDGPPTEVAISPDGSKIAWSFAAYECPPGADCGVRVATGYTDATRVTPVTRYRSTYYDSPSWVGNSRTLQTGSSLVHIHDLGRPASTQWFSDWDYAASGTDLSDAELSPDGRYLAVVRGYGDAQTVLWFTVNGNARYGPPPATPTPLCITNESPDVSSPTWAPGSAAIAYAYPEGIYVKTAPGACSAPQPKLVAPGGTHPDWSAAPLK